MSYDEGMASEIALVEVYPFGGAAIQFASAIEEFDPQQGDKDGEGIAMVNGGRRWKRSPEGDYEITMKLYPLSTSWADGEDLSQGFTDLVSNADGSDPRSDTNTHNRDKFRVAILWTDDAAAATAGGTTAAGSFARRISFTEARLTSFKESFADKTLTVDVTFKGPAFDKDAAGTITRESSEDSGAGLPALSSYA